MKGSAEAFYFFLRKTFDIRQGELLRASLMQLYIFLVITTLLIVKPTVNGLFLTSFGVEKLPYAFILVAIVAGVVTTLYSRIVRHLPLNRIINGTLIFSVISLLIFGLFLRINILESLVLYIFYIWVAIFALLTTSQFWVLANIVFNAREAKRLFGFIGAGAIAGGIFGGYFTSIIAQYMGSEFLPFWGAFFLSLCIPINLIVWKKHVAKKQSTLQQKKRLAIIGDHPFKMMLKSRHLTFLASIVGVSVMVAKLVDYQYGGIAAALIPNPDELTSFFGFWLSTFSLISLTMQLLVTRRVVGTYGVGSSLLFLPSVIFLAVLALIFFPGLLATAVFLKMSDSGLKQSINKAAMELLILPIPVNIKNQTKTFIDVFIDSLATGLSGIILIFLVSGLDMSTNAINLMIIILILIWFYLISQVRKEYLISFRKKIESKNNNDHKDGFDITKESVINGLKRVLIEGSDYQQLEVLKKIRGITHKQLFDPIMNLVHHPSDDIKAEALRNLYFYNKPNLESEIEFLSKHDNQNVKIAAFEYMVRHAKENRVSVMEKYLHQEDFKISGAALVSIASETRDNEKLARQFKLKERIQSKLDVLPSISDPDELEFRSITALKAIGNANLSDFYPFINSSFSSDNLAIANATNIAAGNTLNPVFITTLIHNLSKPKLKVSARNALINYGIGIIEIIKTLHSDGEIEPMALRQIPSVIKRIGMQHSVDFLIQLENSKDFVTRYQSLRGLNYLRNNDPHLKYHTKQVRERVLEETEQLKDLLIVMQSHQEILDATKISISSEVIETRENLLTLLRKRIRRRLEYIFRLLELNHANGDVYVIYKGIRSNQSELQTNALEFLDNLLHPVVKKGLIPLLEIINNKWIDATLKLDFPFHLLEDYECFQTILSGDDASIKMTVLYLLQQLNDERYNYMIKDQTKSVDEKVKAFAEKIEANILNRAT